MVMGPVSSALHGPAFVSDWAYEVHSTVMGRGRK